jgi:histone H3/H4
VSTCNSGRFQLAFCSVRCWDAHLPSMNHRGSTYAIEEKVPAGDALPGKVVSAGPAPEPKAPMVTRAYTPPGAAPQPQPAPAAPERRVVRDAAPEKEPEEVLIVASRLKDWIRARADMNTSAEVMDTLSDIVRELTRDAIDNARADGRKTVMARDFRR